MIDHDKDELKSEGEFEDIQEKFKLLLQNHMTRLIFRSKIPGFDNQEVDDLFFKMESEQEKGLANEESATGEDMKGRSMSGSEMNQRVLDLEEKVRLILRYIDQFEKKVKNLSPHSE